MCCLSEGLPLHSWVFTKGQGKGALTPTTPSEGTDSTAIEVEDIPALLRDVARFAEAVEKLKDVVLAEGKHVMFVISESSPSFLGRYHESFVLVL